MLKKSERDLLKMNKRTMPKKSARKSIERKTDGKIPRAMPQKNVKQMLTKTPKQIEREILRMTEGDAENKFGAPTDRLTVPGHETARATGNSQGIGRSDLPRIVFHGTANLPPRGPWS